MKKRLFLLLYAALFVLPASAADFVVDGISYSVSGDQQCEVVRPEETPYSGDIVIPESVTYDGITYSVTSIGVQAFSSYGVTSVTIGNSVETIGNRAFFNCEGLTSVIIGNSVKSIGNEAFQYCTGLTSITIPNSVKEIGEFAFYLCTGVTSITIGNSVETIGNNAFRDCHALTSLTIGNSVETIGNGAFEECRGLTSVTIPNSVTSIGNEAFYYTDLKSVTIGKSITSIGKSNFGGVVKIALPNTFTYDSDIECTLAYDPETAEINENGCVYSKDGKSLLFVPADVTSFDIPKGVTTIGSKAFARCQLKSLIIPEGVTTIGSNAFSFCNLESLTIPGSIETVKAGAFTYCSIARVNFTDWEKWYTNAKLEDLESNPYRNNGEAYSGDTKILTPEIKDGMEEIPDYINYGLSPYKDEIEIPSSIKRIGAYAFYNNKELYHVFLLEGLEEIGESAFEGCELLENQDLPSTLVSIEDNAYKGCTSLTEVVLPEGLTGLGNGVFSGCTKLEKAVLVSDIEALGNNLFMDCYALNKLYLPLNLKHIGDYTFHNCQALDQFTLPSTLETIGAEAFSITRDGGSSLSKLTIPNSVTSIGSGAFQNQKIANLTIGRGLTTIPASAFANNPLNVIKFSEGLTSIEEGAFKCKVWAPESTVQVILPSSLTEIAENAFQNRYIIEMIIPDGVKNLPSGSCGVPTTLTLGSGVKTLAADAFSFNNLITLRVCATTCPTVSDAFPVTDAQNDQLTVIVNSGRHDYYTTNARWKQLKYIIEEEELDITVYLDGTSSLAEEIRMQSGYMPSRVTKMKVEGPLDDNDLRVIKENMVSLRSLDLSEVTNVTAIPDGQFMGSLLSEVILPTGTESIGSQAFASCKLLQMSTLPETLKVIGEGAFYNCIGITITEIPESVETIGNDAFGDCISLREITTGSKLTSLGASAFYGCKLLERVDLSASPIESIGDQTFSDCYELDEVHLPETVTTINFYAFSGTALRDLSFLPSSIETIGAGAFSNIRRLVAATLPSKLTEVSSYIFGNCPRLITVSMPSGITSVGANLLDNDKKLANISCAANDAPAAETGAFDNIRLRYVSLIVPTLSFRSYISAPQWGKFESIQNRLPYYQDPGVITTSVAEDEFQDMLKEDELEAAAEAAAQEQGEEPSQIIRRRSARRAAARKTTYDGHQFAALFDGAQIQTGDEGSGTRFFINPEEGVTITSVKYDGQEMLDKLDGNSLLLPAGSKGKLEVRTDVVVSIDEIGSDVDFSAPYTVYNLSGVKVGSSIEGLAKGIYLVRQGDKTTKVAI